MRRNINKPGRIARAVIGIVSITLSVTDVFEDNFVDNGLMVLGVVSIAASIIQICPLYYFLGINATKTKKLKMY